MSLIAKIRGITRQTSQVPAIEKDAADIYLDDLGRQLVRYQARDLITTAYLSLANGDKTALATANTGEYLDLIQMVCANTSDAAITVTLTDESTTVMPLTIPANQVVNLYFQIPLKQSATGVAWYVDMGDFSTTTININATFTREV